MRTKFGLHATPMDINTAINIAELSLQSCKTTAQLKKQRALLDNRDIRDKINKGLSKAHELKAAMNKEERIRVPETDKFDDDNITADQPAKTQKQLLNKRKLVAKSYNQSTFTNVRVGIHGKELPKFFMDVQSDYCDQAIDKEPGQKIVDWWKQRPDSYTINPTNTSQRDMKATQKFWAARDEIYLADKKEGQPPIGAFKDSYTAKPKRDDNLMNWTKPTEKLGPDE